MQDDSVVWKYMKKILHISTGGTIAQQKNEDGIAVPSEHTEKITNSFAHLIEKHQIDAEISSIILINKDSSNISPSDWINIIETITQTYDAYDAFIITHGTNTLGYTAAALSFALGNLGKKVILTGSQVSAGYLGSDADINMANSIQMAMYDTHRISGVIAVFGSNIITGTRVKKTTEFDYDAFKTFGNTSSVGRIGRDIRIDTQALTEHMKWLAPYATDRQGLDIKNTFETQIISLTEFPGISSELLIHLADLGVKGIIYRASGAGDPNIGNEHANFKNLRDGFFYLQQKKIPIVVTTYAADGIASMNINEPGKLAKDLGAIPAWDMSLEAMTVKLQWLLGQGKQYEEIQSLMIQSFRGEIEIH